MAKVNVVTVIAPTLHILTFAHCPPPPPDIFCCRQLRAGLVQHISWFRLEAKRTAVQQVCKNDQVIYYVDKFVFFAFTSVQILTPEARELQLLLLLHTR
jgi:hypothetical protein